MTHPRLIASLTRITDPQTACEVMKHTTMAARDLQGRCIAGQIPSGTTPGVVIDETWLETATDVELDGALAHELVHACYGPGGAGLMAALGNLARLKARVIPKWAKDDYNTATDALVEDALRATGILPADRPATREEVHGALKDLLTS